MKADIVFFDFDGTITTKDTFLEFIKFYRGSYEFYKGFLINSPFLIAYKLNIIPNYQAKERILRYFFKDERFDHFQGVCDDFATRCLPKLIRPNALLEIERLKKENIEVVIVSASAENWITKWSTALGLRLIATKLEVRDNKITGNIDGRNCYGAEKVNRIKEIFEIDGYKAIHAYGDSRGDREMFEIAHKTFFKPFRNPTIN